MCLTSIWHLLYIFFEGRLINIPPLTLRRWTLCGKMPANKNGKKWVNKKQTLIIRYNSLDNIDRVLHGVLCFF